MNKEFETSLKSIETENILDLYFYRPIGFQLARALRNTGITPNMVTILSIFVGGGAGFLFYFNHITCNLAGILLLVMANMLDCVDGQLARLTGIKSEIGRILDGVAGDIWFILIYVGLALRLTDQYDTAWFFVPAVVSGLSHLFQANITDYYKTVHLYFVSKEKGQEFQNQEQLKAQQKERKGTLNRFLYALYETYTHVQENMTPTLQHLLKKLRKKYGDDIPEHIRLLFRQKSAELMKRYIDWMTFNGRTIVLFAVVISGHVWVYFVFEIIVLNFVLFLSIRKHEKMCGKICKTVQ